MVKLINKKMFPKNYFDQPRLCLITDRKISKRPIIDAIKKAVEAGVDIVQLREKDFSTKEYFELAREVKIICKDHPTLLIINDRVDVALAVDADGVHLGWRSLPLNVVRHLLGKEKLIGISTHSKDDAISAEENGADYITLGPVFDTPSKKGLVDPLGIKNFYEIKKCVSIPVLAIGGIKENNAVEIIKAGANGITVISAILLAEDISKAVKTLKQKLQV